MRFRPTPATLLSGVALFFAVGGSALAVSDAVRPQARCATGAVRGIAAVTGAAGAGIGNIPDKFSSSKALFGRTFNCAGGAVEVRRASAGVFEVRFAGNGAQTALVTGIGGSLASVDSLAGGTFRVTVYVAGRNDPNDVPFVVVLV
jgi:hypothetical protein